ncbi:NYN domain-containing protein [candidate division KSB1 bacterium]|nr:NYN domain-containing protein [candidate division KSB1 bacterium]
MTAQQLIIVDGYNYILRQKFITDDDKNSLWHAREELIRQLIAFRGNKQINITIVFDGQDLKGLTKAHRPRGINIMFSEAPQKADPLIIRLIEKSPQPRNISLVTSDRSLANLARSIGCMVWSTKTLAKKLPQPDIESEYKNKFNTTLTPKELEEWEQIFNNGKYKK